MAGMSRDKCGAAAAAGDGHCDQAPASGVKVVAARPPWSGTAWAQTPMSRTRSHQQGRVRLRVGNTDAEGRDGHGRCLATPRRRRSRIQNPQLMTIATDWSRRWLWAHSSIMDNGPAKVSGTARTGPGGWGQGWRHVRDQHQRGREDWDFYQGQEWRVCDGAAVQQRAGYCRTLGFQFPPPLTMTVAGLTSSAVGLRAATQVQSS